MEREIPFPHYQLPKSSSGLNFDHHNNNNNPNPTLTSNANMNNSTTLVQPQTSMVREQDQYMAIANVIRIMRRILPLHAKISDDAKKTIQKCVSEYINFVTCEANERCQREKRKTITANDIMYAMEKLGFEDYVGPLELFINRYREFESKRGCSVRGESSSFRQAHVGNGAEFNSSPYDPHHGLVHGPSNGPVNGPTHSPVHGPTNGPVHGPSHGPPSPSSYGYGMLDKSMVMSGGRYYQNGPGQDGPGGSGGYAPSMNGLPFF